MKFEITKDQSAFLLASHLPKGRVWEGGFDASTNFGRLITALSVEYYRLTVLCEKLSTEMNIDTTNELLTDWEKSVGIPNEYFATTETDERRREQIKQLFSNFGGVQIAADFIRVADFFGFEITVTPGKEVLAFPIPFPLHFSSGIKETTHTIFVHIVTTGAASVFFPIPFPLHFSSGGESFLRLIFEILIPANVQLIFI